jgi:hypothetical protein
MLGQGGDGRLAEAVAYFQQEIDAWLEENRSTERQAGLRAPC